jgi:hypothetical protein
MFLSTFATSGRYLQVSRLFIGIIHGHILEEHTFPGITLMVPRGTDHCSMVSAVMF